MQTDEQQIRELVSAWMAATRAGDIEAVMSLMSEDVVFLTAGQAPMRKVDFELLAKSQAEADAPHIEGRCDIQEIRILNDWAFMSTHLTVRVTPPGAHQTMTRAGYTLTILKKENGRWLLARDANMLAPVE